MNQLKSSILLLITAMIWGCAFVAQSAAMDAVGPWTFTFCRSILAFVFLLVLSSAVDQKKKRSGILPQKYDRKTWKGGIWTGIALAVATMLQQTGILYTTVGKAGFITALYVVIVPVFSLFLHKKVKPVIWLCVVLSICGLFLLSDQSTFLLSRGDLLVVLCAFAYAVQIMLIDHYAPYCDGIKLSCIQFLAVCIVTVIPMLVIEHPSFSAITAAAVPILYAGFLSSGVGYTLQIIAQKDSDPSIDSMIMSLESVFSALAGYLILHQTLSSRELLGCGIMFTAILLAQIPERKEK